jgi:hypothetical protein
MLNKVRLWVRRFLRHIILAISVGVGLASLGILLPECGFSLRTPIAQTMLGVILGLSFMVSLISGFWYQIPLERIQQTRNPSKWVSAEIKALNNSQYLIYHKDFVEMNVKLKSDLNFDIELRSLRGTAFVNGKETNSTLQEQTKMKLFKHSSRNIEKWRLYGWADCIKDTSRVFETQIVVQLRLSGEDTKNRFYQRQTDEFSVRL